MLERLWAEIGHIGKVYLIGLIFLSIGVGILDGIGNGFITEGIGVVVYAFLRMMDSIDWGAE